MIARVPQNGDAAVVFDAYKAFEAAAKSLGESINILLIDGMYYHATASTVKSSDVLTAAAAVAVKAYDKYDY